MGKGGDISAWGRKPTIIYKIRRITRTLIKYILASALMFYDLEHNFISSVVSRTFFDFTNYANKSDKQSNIRIEIIETRISIIKRTIVS